MTQQTNQRILISGASGNVGGAVLAHLKQYPAVPVCASYAPEKEKGKFKNEQIAALDFMRSETFQHAFDGIDAWFLMRPPQISDTKKYLFPAIDAAMAAGVKRIVFLSLLGIEENPRVPHYPVEQYLRTKDVEWTFVRPSFFMQNLSTTHRTEILGGKILLPVKSGRTSFIDARDIGEVIAKCLMEEGHAGKAYEITGPEALDYYQVAQIFTEVLDKPVVYQSPSLPSFFFRQLGEGRQPFHALVMCMLYDQTRRGMADVVNDQAAQLLGREPRTLKTFIQDHREVWL